MVLGLIRTRILLVFITPILISYCIWRKKDDLDDPEVKMKYGFIYNGYKNHRFYWYIIICIYLFYQFRELTIMARKALIIFVAVFLISFGVVTQVILL